MKVIEREYKGYILYASSEESYQNLCSDVDNGNTNGFIRKSYQANTGSGWFDIRWEDIDGFKSQNVPVRSLDEVDQQLTTPKEIEGEEIDLEEENLKAPNGDDNLLEALQKALCSDGGEYWINPDEVISAFSKEGYSITRK